MNYGSTLRIQMVNNKGKVFAEHAFTLKAKYPHTELAEQNEVFWQKANAALGNIISHIELAEKFSSFTDDEIIAEASRRGFEVITPLNDSLVWCDCSEHRS